MPDTTATTTTTTGTTAPEAVVGSGAGSDQSYPCSPSGYALGPVIGYGAFAVVYKAKIISVCNAHEGEEVAIKLVDLDSMEGTTFDDIRRELQIMRLSTHPNVISYHVAFPVESKMWLVMPLVNGGSCQAILKELKKLKISNGIRNPAIIAYILRETAEALDHCHKNQTLHRDLKASNLLVSLSPAVFLSDFGVSASLRDTKQRQTFVGTPCWMSPEVLEQKISGYSYPADVWSFGITCCEIATGAAPYQHLHPLKVMKSVIDNPPPKIEDLLTPPPMAVAGGDGNARLRELALGEENIASGGMSLDKDLVKLVSECLQKEPSKRPSFDQILDKYKAFFDKAQPQAMAELLQALPPLDAREQQAPALAQHRQKKGNSNAQDPLSGEWNFDLEDEEEEELHGHRARGGKTQDAEFPGIGEEEF